MRKPQSPCLDCADREPGCHGECEAFREYSEQQVRYKDNIISSKKQENAHIAPFSQMRENYKRRRRNIK